MNKKNLVVCFLAALLAGCISTSQPVFTKHYALTPPTPPAATVPQNTAAPILRVADIAAPAWLDSTSMYYRLGYQGDAGIAAYARSDWIAPPPKLLQGLVEDALSGSGDWKAVIGTGAAAESDLSLNLQLNDFEQLFSAAKQSAGVLDLTATLIDDHASKVVAQRTFHIEKPAPSADAAGGVKALNEAAAEFAQQLKQWLGGAVARQSH